MSNNLFSQSTGANLFSEKPTTRISLSSLKSQNNTANNKANNAANNTVATPQTSAHLENAIIIGSGPAGYTAAIYLARAGYRPLLLTGELEPGGQLVNTTEIENFPGFPDGIEGPDLMERMKAQAVRFGTRLEAKDVASVAADGTEKTVTTSDGSTYRAKAVIITTGSHYNKLGVSGEAEYSGHGVSYCATCDGFFFKGRPIVVVGGGDSALTEALYLARFGSSVTIIHRRGEFRASKVLVDRAAAEKNIEFVMNATVQEVLGDGTSATGVVLHHTDTDSTSTLDASGIFVAIGSSPNTEFLAGSPILDDRGFITVDGASTRTSVPGVFAAGDVVDDTYRQAISAAGMGCRAALDAQAWLEK
jgi:thioredoxin reductase (NADPH)